MAAVVAAAGLMCPGAASGEPSGATPLDSLTACPAGTGAVPVVLIHGTNATVDTSLGLTRQGLVADGRCVYGPDYDSTEPLSVSVDYLAAVIDRILELNGARMVDVVGKSQGGLIARAVSLTFSQRDSHPVRQVVAISGPQHGVTISAGSAEIGSVASALPGLPPALRDMLAGSPFLTALDSNGMTAAGVRYTLIGTRTDRVVTPYTSSFIDAPDVTNILIQDGCPEDLAGHLAESADPRTVDLTLHALDPNRHPDVRCVANSDER
ncbi:esterase/lipase family protein [Nocardia spumae]|uniref:esterase/lipase family protein n=1 Tax=Nocardia spumae TaxID=2887190 RepID=UPI0030D81B9D